MPLLNGKQVESLTVPALKSELKKLGLSTEGVKVVLIVRLSKKSGKKPKKTSWMSARRQLLGRAENMKDSKF
ncbi:hypothetical protein B9Z55_003554 [Caenorhabditis nigoni]|uniref:SAP domain-containing protein n=1 Tax=Caenorhabditis nigoni TaxID=1611254 RepID=A0A2G5VRL3_9PELO|nr:hypothetical protein B9Z55_003554 [Caenorhabditis nigoni]